MLFKKGLPVIVISALLVGCAKEKQYDEVYKDPEQTSRSMVKTHKLIKDENGKMVKVPVKYMYVPMTQGSPREVKAAKPFYQGDEKLVRLEWAENGLNVIEIERDERFADNEHNESPVLTIPGTYSSYRCAEDDFGDCTNREEENTEIEWEDKAYFTPDFAGLEVKELNFLDVVGVNSPECMSVTDTKVKNYEISDGVVNVELEKTFKIHNAWSCYRMNYIEDKFNYNSFKVSYFYSIVELDQLASKDYEPINYPIKDQDVFGFFKTKNVTLSDDLDHRRANEQYLVNRFNPNQPNGKLVYYLSKSFNKPKNALYKKATFDGVEVFNKGLKAANVPFEIELREQTESDNISPGDLRYNTVVLIDDPLASGLLGYGPSVKNPYTGEILQAHTNMYGGVLTKIVRSTYESAVDITIEQNNFVAKDITGKFKVDPVTYGDLPKKLLTELVPTELLAEPSVIAPEESELSTGTITTEDETAHDNHENIAAKLFVEDIDEKKLQKQMRHRLHQKRNFKAEYARLLDGDFEGMDEMEVESFKRAKAQGDVHLTHKHQPEFFPIANTTKVVFPELLKIEGVLNEDGKTLKRWAKLTDTQKNKIREIILYHSYLGTFIHEFGHNFGLRHNFIGSFDKDNFYTKEEAKALGLDGVPAYTSVMDYAYSEFNQLPVLGKYDIAALRYAYAREVEKNDGSVHKVTGSVFDMQQQFESQTASLNAEAEKLRRAAQKIFMENPAADVDEFMQNSDEIQQALALEKKASDMQLKSYEFCTDENAGLSARCNRFDEGTSLTEIVKHKIQRYEQYYRYRNLRDGRLEFSAYDIVDYFLARRGEFGFIRDIVEDYEFLSGLNSFFRQALETGCSDVDKKVVKILDYPTCDMIEDRKSAVTLASNFLIDVIKTPDHVCALASKTRPNVIIELRPLKDIYDDIKYDVNYVPMTCFDDAVVKGVNEASDKEELIIVGENGKFINGFKDNDPNFKYITDRAVRGVWVDKAVAMKQLYTRRWRHRSTDRNHMALMDIPEVKEKVENIIEHMLMGKPLKEPVPFKTENGSTFQIPYMIGLDTKVDQIEDNFGGFKRYLGIPQNGNAELSKVLLNQIMKLGFDFNTEVSEKAFDLVQFFSIKHVNGYIPDGDRNPKYMYLEDDFRTYVARPNHKIAYNMVAAILNTMKLEKMDKKVIASVFNRRTNPQAPDYFTEEQKAFFAVPMNLMEIILGNPDLVEQQFVGVFGPQQGPLVFKIYKKGPEVMKPIIDLKRTMLTTPANVDNQSEIELYNMPLELLADYLNGKITADLLQFYSQQLDKLIYL